MAAMSSSEIPKLLNQVFDCIKAAKGETLVTGLKEINQFFGSINEYAFKQMGAQIASSGSEDVSSTKTANSKSETAASQAILTSKPTPALPNEPQASEAFTQPLPKQPQSEPNSAAAQAAVQVAPSPSREASKESSNGESHQEDSSADCGLPKTRDGHVAVCSTTILIKQIPKFWSDKKVRERAEEFGVVQQMDYKPYLNTAAMSFKNRADAFKALSGIPRTRPLIASWELNAGVSSSYFKKYWDVNEGTTFIPVSMFPWMKQRELLLGGALLLDPRQPAASKSVAGPVTKPITTANKPITTSLANQPASQVNKAAASPLEVKSATASAGISPAAKTATAGAGTSPAVKASTGVQNAKNMAPSPAQSSAAQTVKPEPTRVPSTTANQCMLKGASPSKPQADNVAAFSLAIPSLFANDYTKATKPATTEVPRTQAPNKSSYDSQSQQTQSRANPNVSPNQIANQGRSVGATGLSVSASRPSNQFASPATGLSGSASRPSNQFASHATGPSGYASRPNSQFLSSATTGSSVAASRPNNQFASPASRAQMPSATNTTGQQHPPFQRFSRTTPESQQQQQYAAFGKRNSLEATYGSEVKRPRIDDSPGRVDSSSSGIGSVHSIGRGYVPGRKSFESSNIVSDRPMDMNRSAEYPPQSARQGQAFGQFANQSAGIRPFVAARPVSNQGLLQPPPASGPRLGSTPTGSRPFRF